METSDSECFESAGEDFYSDDEKTEPCEKEPIRKAKHLSTGYKYKNASDSSSENIDKIDQNPWQSKDFSIPPARTVCWEPGMDYEVEQTDELGNRVSQIEDHLIKDKKNTPSRSTLIETAEIKTSINQRDPEKGSTGKLESYSESGTKECGIPPEIEKYGEEDVNKIPLKNRPVSYELKDDDTKKSGCCEVSEENVHMIASKCKLKNEPSLDETNVEMSNLKIDSNTKSNLLESESPQTKEDIQNPHISKLPMPKYGIPPQKVVCPFPRKNAEKGYKEDANTISLKNKPTQCKPKSDNTKKSEYTEPPEVVQCWEEGVHTISTKSILSNKPPEDDIQNPHMSKVPSETQNKDEIEENMWEDDDWPIDENNLLTSKVDNSKIKEGTPKLKVDNFEIKADAARNDKEGNMWEHDWGDFEDPHAATQPDVSKQQQSQRDEINMWEDDWEPIENIPKTDSKSNVQEPKKDTGWGSWGSWGLSSVISTATNITNQVSQSITTVLETGIGAPNPEELAKIDREVEKELKDLSDGEQEEKQEEEKPILGFDLGTLVHGVTKLVETTGSKVITGGLDTLETIGKKTMEVLQENDPGLKKKRAFLKLNDDKPILSHMLREAKEKAEKENQELEKKNLIVKKPNYETIFDDHQGLVHLEALEMLSKQCDIKLSTLIDASTGESLTEMQETMDQIKELCELPEEEEEILTTEDIKERLEASVKELNVQISYDRLHSTWSDVESWLENADTNIINSAEIHQQAIESLAQLTAISVEQFHKGGELLLVKQHRSTADEADALVQLTVTLTTLIGIISTKFSEKLNKVVENGADKKEVNELITNVFFEAANSGTYIQDAFQLLIPILQVGAV